MSDTIIFEQSFRKFCEQHPDKLIRYGYADYFSGDERDVLKTGRKILEDEQVKPEDLLPERDENGEIDGEACDLNGAFLLSRKLPVLQDGCDTFYFCLFKGEWICDQCCKEDEEKVRASWSDLLVKYYSLMNRRKRT